jgi:hypothetical protein
MKILNSILFEKKEVALGTGSVTQYILFENKHLFSVIFYRWNTIDQVRFHTHAFASFAFLLKGFYWEKIKFGDIEMDNLVNQPLWPRYIPKNYCHSVGHAKPGTLTMVLAGPWQKHWYEFFPDTETWVKYTWGRKKLGKYKQIQEGNNENGTAKECKDS